MPLYSSVRATARRSMIRNPRVELGAVILRQRGGPAAFNLRAARVGQRIVGGWPRAWEVIRGSGGVRWLEAEVDSDRFDVPLSGAVHEVAWERLLSRRGRDHRVALRPVGEWHCPQRAPHAGPLRGARLAGPGEVASPVDRTIRMANILMPVDVQEPNQHRPLATAAPAAHRQLCCDPDAECAPPRPKDRIEQPQHAVEEPE